MFPPPLLQSLSIIGVRQTGGKIAFDIVEEPTSVFCDIYFRNPAERCKKQKPDFRC